MRRKLFAGVFVVAAGCYSSHSIEPEPSDAGGEPDAAIADAATTDAATADAATTDAAIGDAGPDTSMDASVDAGLPCGERGPHRLAVGKTHSCFIDDECSLFCWGSNENGQLGQGDTAPRTSPVPFGDDSWRAVAVYPSYDGESRTCAIRVDGSLWCAGRALDRSIVDQPNPTLWHPGPWAALSLTDTFNGIRTDGSLWAFGPNFYGSVGRGGTDWACTPVPNYVQFVQVGDGPYWSGLSGRLLGGCALRSGERWCWGVNGNGELGLGDTTRRCAPTPIGGESDWELVSYGSVACGLRDEGTLYCAGHNLRGQLDPSNPSDYVTTPVQVLQSETFRSVSSGVDVTCAVTTGHVLRCWGCNWLGLLGDGVPSAVRLGPVQVGPGIEWDYVHVDPHATAACAVTTSGALHCWGKNEDGQVGTGDTDPVSSPTPIELP